MSATNHSAAACGEIRSLLPALCAGELSGADEARVRDHLAACPACRAEWEAEQALSAALAMTAEELASEAGDPPSELQERVRAAVHDDVLRGRETQAKRLRFRRLTATLAAAALLLVVTGAALPALLRNAVKPETEGDYGNGASVGTMDGSTADAYYAVEADSLQNSKNGKFNLFSALLDWFGGASNDEDAEIQDFLKNEAVEEDALNVTTSHSTNSYDTLQTEDGALSIILSENALLTDTAGIPCELEFSDGTVLSGTMIWSADGTELTVTVDESAGEPTRFAVEGDRLTYRSGDRFWESEG